MSNDLISGTTRITARKSRVIFSYLEKLEKIPINCYKALLNVDASETSCLGRHEKLLNNSLCAPDA